MEKTANTAATDILDNQSFGFGKGQYESALKAMKQYAELQIRKDREETKENIRNYWKFDNNQQPCSSWHDKNDLLATLERPIII